MHLNRLCARARFASALTSSMLLFANAALAQDMDMDAATRLLDENKCGKCHSLDKQKDGPAYKKIAANHKGKADAESKLVTHLKTGPMVEIDGVKEAHAKIKAKDDAAVRNAVRYILSR